MSIRAAQYVRMSTEHQQYSTENQADVLREYAAMDVRLVLPSLLAPTLVVHRRGDLFVPVEAGRFFASLVPGATFVELEGEDHLPYVGHVDAVTGTIDKFLRGLMPTRELG
jgi:pimeloyl-ACP methyl ester carboxylesterase